MSAYLSARESAASCGVSEKTIRNWIASGRLSAGKSAGAFRIAQDDLDALRAERPHHPQGAESASAEVRADGGPQGAAGSAVVAGLTGLVALVDRLTVENRQLAETAAVWQERARVLTERLALAAPPQSQAGVGASDPPDPTPEPPPRPAPFPWPIPPHPNVRALAPWLLLVAILGAAAVFGWLG